MNVSPFRALAVTAAALLVLAGCAVPGKGAPGVVAVYSDRVITDGDITAIREGLNVLCSYPQPAEDLTLLLVGPEVVSIAEGLGYRLTDEQLVSQAELWIAFREDATCYGNELTTNALEVVRIVQSLALLMHDPEGISALVLLAKDIENGATISPRYGDFTLSNFDSSVSSIKQYIDDNALALGGAQFVIWKEINGFSITSQPEWISSG